ncbi:MAG: prepilin-type N-terminal cleavage/methylation domain-containing protein [Sporolactobacillus sp.]|jgi:competence protein ComGF|nr:prepilin-type N-terminal cleavage/methylation domain-containing protein [Sporolactobacillus sp.]
MRNERGFTLLSMMLALSILTVALLMTTALARFAARSPGGDMGISKQIDLFYTQTSNELHRCDRVAVSEDHHILYLYRQGKEVSYRLDDSLRLIRMVDNDGYEIVLQNIRAVRFDRDGPLLSVHLTDRENHDYFLADRLYLETEDTDETDS